MSLLNIHSDENSMLLLSSKFVLARTTTSTDRNVVSCSNNNNPEIRTKLSPISANGVFSKYNAYSNHNYNYKSSINNVQCKVEIKEVISENNTKNEEDDEDYEDENDQNNVNNENNKIIKYRDTNKNGNEEISNMKKFKNPFASNSIVSSIGTLELKGITNASFTTMSISTKAFDNISAEYNQQVENSIRINHCNGNDTNNDNNNGTINDRKLDTILRIAKKLLGDEMIADLMITPSTSTEYRATTKVKLCGESEGKVKVKVKEEGSYKEDYAFSGNIGDYVERVMEQEMTLSSWTWHLTVRKYSTVSAVSAVSTVCSLECPLLKGLEEDCSCQTVVIRTGRIGRTGGTGERSPTSQSNKSSQSDDRSGDNRRKRRKKKGGFFRFWHRFFSTSHK